MSVGLYTVASLTAIWVVFVPRHNLPFILRAEFLLSYQQLSLAVVLIGG